MLLTNLLSLFFWVGLFAKTKCSPQRFINMFDMLHSMSFGASKNEYCVVKNYYLQLNQFILMLLVTEVILPTQSPFLVMLHNAGIWQFSQIVFFVTLTAQTYSSCPCFLRRYCSIFVKLSNKNLGAHALVCEAGLPGKKRSSGEDKAWRLYSASGRR